MPGNKRGISFELDADGAQNLAQIIGFVRAARTATRPEITQATSLSRSLATKYVDIACDLNLLKNGEIGQSTGGRAPQLLNFNQKAGHILVAELGALAFMLLHRILLAISLGFPM
jgi:hypothetical protein